MYSKNDYRNYLENRLAESDNFLMHYGVLGMHWGVRRYQPYSVVPRSSGKTGKEIGEANKAAKNNVKKAYSDIRKNAMYLERAEKKYARSGDDKYLKSSKYKKRKATADKAMDEIRKADKQLGTEKVDKILNNKQTMSTILPSMVGTAGMAYLSSMGVPLPPFAIVPDLRARATARYINDNEGVYASKNEPSKTKKKRDNK